MAQPLRIRTTSTPHPHGLDFAAVKARQQRTWASGDYSLIATLIHASAERLVQSADLEAGWRVLDVATGSGNAALAAARCRCEVIGVDYVPELLESARRRADAEGLAIEFREGDAEALPFDGNQFDAAISVFGVMFAPDQERVASELVRVVRPGGRIALASWTPEGFVGGMLRIVSKFVPPPSGTRPSVLWGQEERVRELFAGALSALEMKRRHFVFRFRSAAEFVEVFRSFYGPILKAFEAVGPEGARELAAELEALARQWNRNPGEPIAIPGEYLEVVATKR
jgi:ubiquinone/menaquinone biosynthesis C-methylase UbiE